MLQMEAEEALGVEVWIMWPPQGYSFARKKI